mgnify:CR=1 FL=1
MKSKVKEQSETEVTVEVTLPSDRVNEVLDKIYQQNVQELDIPGFRKGNIPRSFLKARFGDDIFHEQAQEELINEALPEALAEQELKSVSEPDIEIVNFEEDEDFTFEATVEIMPEVEVSNYKDMKIEDVPFEPVEEEEIEERLTELRREQGQLVPKEEEEVEDSDIVILEDDEGNMDRITVDGEEGSPTKPLIGQKVGQLANLHSEDLNIPEGKTFTIADLKKVELPELDDELARDFGHESIEEMREDLKQELQTEKEEERNEKLKDKIVEKIIDSSGFSAPEEMVKNVAQERMRNFKEQLGEESYQKYLEGQSTTEGKFQQKLIDSARSEIQRELILDKIAEQEGITLTDEEFEERLERKAEESDVNPVKFKSQLKAEDELESYRESLVREKVLDFLLSNVDIEEVGDE